MCFQPRDQFISQLFRQLKLSQPDEGAVSKPSDEKDQSDEDMEDSWENFADDQDEDEDKDVDSKEQVGHFLLYLLMKMIKLGFVHPNLNKMLFQDCL